MLMNSCPLCGKTACDKDEYVVQTKYKQRKVTTYFHRECFEKITRRAMNERLCEQSNGNNN